MEMRLQFLPLTLVAVSSFAAQSPEYKSCTEAASTQFAMNKCADDEARRTDAELNRVYQELLSRAAKNPDAVRKIRAAQRAWISFRDAHISSVFPAQDKQANYGSMYPMCVLEIFTDLTRQRTAMLKAMMIEKGCGEAY